MKVIKQKFNATLNQKSIKIILGLLLMLMILLLYILLKDNSTFITHKQANRLFTENKIVKLLLDKELIYIYTKHNQYKIYKNAINKKTFFERYLIEIKDDKSYMYDLLSLLILFAAVLFMFYMIRQNNQKLQIASYENQSSEVQVDTIQALSSTITFNDVAGIKDVKEELEEIIDFLKDPQKYKTLDIRLPKGVLLVGPPGVGKTLISKAVAGEAGVPFFYQSGASFVHIYVGMGAKRVSELFIKAKQMAPSIIFIDEIDAVGKSRGEFRNDEREATLNQLLTEMDGFEESSGVIVIGATNQVDVLDDALLRAGRFDRRIHISLPDLDDRVKTLELYLTHKPHNVDIVEIARMTVGFNSAALDTLTNEAAIYTMRDGRNIVETSDFEAVKEKVLMGKRKILSFSEKEREIQAVYQAAKAVVATWLDIEFDKIGIVTTKLIIQENEILSHSSLMNKIKFYLSGSVATKRYYNEQFTNGKEDIQEAKKLIHKVVYEYAMNDNFIITPAQEERLLKQAVKDMNILLETLEKALSEISSYLLIHENITYNTCKDILREIF